MPPKKSNNSKKKAEDDDDKFLEEQMATQAAQAAKLAAEKHASDARTAEKQQKQAEADKAQRLAKAKAAQDLPPIFVDDVVKRVVEISHNCNLSAVSSTRQGNHMNDMCWIAYVINNFLSLAVESNRFVSMRTILHPHGERVLSFEVHDDRQPNEQHSWNVITTQTGVYAIDVTLEQFIPAGRYGYRRDIREDEGWIPVKAASRLVVPAAGGAAEPTPLVGIIAIDGGILPDGPVVVSAGVPDGTYKKYMRFLADAHSGRFNKMTAEERRAGEILFKNKAIPQWLKLHEKLIEQFMPQ